MVYSPHIVMGNGVSIRCTEKNLRNRALFYTNRLNTEFRDAVTCVFGSDCNADMNGIYRVIRSGDRGQACFVLGYGLSEKAAKNILSKYANFSYCKKQLEKVVLYYDSFQAVTIETADETLNLFYNTFLMYQVAVSYTHLLPATVILPMGASILLFLLCKNIFVSLLAFLPLWQILKYALEFFYSKTTRSQILPRMKITQHCPKTLVTIITLIGKKADVDELVHKMEQYHYGNDTSGIMIGVLADLPQCADPLTEQDIELVRYLKKKTELLNQRFSNVFFAAVRKRTLSPDHVYTGRERKRGAVCDFFEAVAGTGEDRFLLLQGDVRDAKYFVALDSDTNPHAETIRKLVGILEHPLAQPVYNDDCTCVVDGYGIAARCV